MISRYNNISLATGVPGIALQIVGRLQESLPVIMLGTGLLLIGFAYYAKAKGRNPAWCLAAFLSIIGLVILACLKDLSHSEPLMGRQPGPRAARPETGNPYQS